ncbi:MAG: pyridoxamine 5'-phosphate oxidase family protein [Caulobacteraceae bacterium]
MDAAAKTQITDILARGQDLTLATIREDGFPQAVTLSYVAHGLTIYFGTDANSQKARNMARCPKVSVTVNLPYHDWKEIEGVSLAGIAERITDPSEIARAARLMLAKFPQTVDFMEPSMPPPALFRVTPVVVSVLDYAKGFGHTDLVAVQPQEAAAA